MEVYLGREAEVAKLRRLHLIVIDLQHPRRPQSAAAKMAYQGMLEARETWVANTLPIPFKRGENWRCRYAYAYGLDGSDLPCLTLWPERTAAGSFWLLDCATTAFYATSGIENLGPEHFSAAFGLKGSRNVRRAAARSFKEDCSVAMAAVRKLRLLSHSTPAEQRAKKKAKKEVIVLPRHRI